MPWSKIVKRCPDKAIQRYRLEDVPLPSKTSHKETEAREMGVSTEEARTLSSDDRPDGGAPLFSEDNGPEYQSAFQAGYAQGLKEGEVKGFATGKAVGFVKGEVKGFSDGKIKGFSEGEKKGFAAGEAQGLAEGEEQGFAKGKTQGLAEGKTIREEELQEIEATRQLLLRFIEDFKDVTETYISEAEHDLIQMVLAVAQKIVRHELAQNDEALLKMVQTALKKVSPISAVLLRVHPKDMERLTQRSPDILEAVGGIGRLRIEPDPKLTPGDSILETEDRIVDMRLEMQLAEIGKKLLSQDPKEPEDETSSQLLHGSD